MPDTPQETNEFFRTDVTDKVAVIHLHERAFEIMTELEPSKTFISSLDLINKDQEIVGLVLIKDNDYQEEESVKAFLSQIHGDGGYTAHEFSTRLARIENINERITRAFHDFSKPLVAGIKSVTTHEFLAQSLLFDFRLATHSTVSVFPNIKMGVPPSGNLVYQFQRFIGHGRTTEILLSGEPIPAEQLFSLGLVSRLVDDQNLLEECIKRIESLSALPPHALIATRKTLGSNKDEYRRFIECAKEGHKHILAHLQAQAKH